MNTYHFTLPLKYTLECMLPILRGRAFHVTVLDNLSKILQDREIRPGATDTRRRPFGDYNSYFRNKGCISIFDYRSITEQQLQKSLEKCSPDQPLLGLKFAAIAIFVLLTERCPELISPSQCEDIPYKETIVPYVEAGHHGPLSLDFVDELLIVEAYR